MKKEWISIGISAVIVLAVFGMIASVQAQAPPVPTYEVWGYVCDQDGETRLNDVAVTVTDTNTSASASDITDGVGEWMGYYKVALSGVYIGDPLQIVATKGDCLTNKTPVTATEDFPLRVDLILEEDTTPPTITNMQPADGSCVNGSTLEICADYSDAAGINTSSVIMKVGGDEVTVAPSETGVCYTPGDNLDDGEYTVMVNVSDICGNPNSTSWSFTVDTIPPTIEFQEPPTPENDTEVTVNYVNVSVNVTDNGCGIDNATVKMTWNGTAYQMVEYMYALAEGKYSLNMTDLPNGEHTYWVQANDTAGNTRVSETRVVKVNVAGIEYSFTIGFVMDYNVLSLPLNDTSVTNASTLIAKIGPECEVVYKWNTTTPGWQSYQSGMPPWDNFDIIGGEGYFVRMSDPEEVEFSGMGWESPFTISLVKEYNVLSLPLNDTSVTNASTLIAKIGPECEVVYKWNTTTPGWQSYQSGMPPWDNFDIIGGEGYFVRMSGDADVMFEGEPWEN